MELMHCISFKRSPEFSMGKSDMKLETTPFKLHQICQLNYCEHPTQQSLFGSPTEQ